MISDFIYAAKNKKRRMSEPIMNDKKKYLTDPRSLGLCVILSVPARSGMAKLPRLARIVIQQCVMLAVKAVHCSSFSEQKDKTN